MLNENTPTIKTKRLLLRKFTKADTSAMLEILSDTEVNAFLPWFPVETMEKAGEFLYEHYLSYYNKPCAYRYAICLKENNKPIGYIGISDGESNDLGYGLKKEFWNQGIVSEAAIAVVERISQSGYEYITATHDVFNPHSGGVMKRLGMSYKYSYVEKVQPKNISVTFRLYQLNFTKPSDYTYNAYWDKFSPHFVENFN